MTTALIVQDPRLGEIRVKVMTSVIKSSKGPLVQSVLHQCDEEWLPMNILASSYSDSSEEEIHRQIRAEAFEKNQLVEGESTNVELNPNYNEEDHIIREEE